MAGAVEQRRGLGARQRRLGAEGVVLISVEQVVGVERHDAAEIVAADVAGVDKLKHRAGGVSQAESRCDYLAGQLAGDGHVIFAARNVALAYPAGAVGVIHLEPAPVIFGLAGGGAGHACGHGHEFGDSHGAIGLERTVFIAVYISGGHHFTDFVVKPAAWCYVCQIGVRVGGNRQREDNRCGDNAGE